MKSSTKDQAEGKYHEMKGKATQFIGKLGNNRKLEVKGFSEIVAGKFQGKIGQVKKALGK